MGVFPEVGDNTRVQGFIEEDIKRIGQGGSTAFEEYGVEIIMTHGAVGI